MAAPTGGNSPADRVQQHLSTGGYEVDEGHSGFVRVNGKPRRVQRLNREGSLKRVGESIVAAFKGLGASMQLMGLRRAMRKRSDGGTEEQQQELQELQDTLDKNWKTAPDTKAHWGAVAKAVGKFSLAILCPPLLISESFRNWASASDTQNFYFDLTPEERQQFHNGQQKILGESGYDPYSRASVGNFLRDRFNKAEAGNKTEPSFYVDENTKAAVYVDDRRGRVLFAPAKANGEIDYTKARCLKVTKKGQPVVGPALEKFAKSYAVAFDDIQKSWGDEVDKRMGARFTDSKLLEMRTKAAQKAQDLDTELSIVDKLSDPAQADNLDDAELSYAMQHYRPNSIMKSDDGFKHEKADGTEGDKVELDNLTNEQKEEIVSSILYNRLGETASTFMREAGFSKLDQRMDLEAQFMRGMRDNPEGEHRRGDVGLYLGEKYGTPPTDFAGTTNEFYAQEIHRARQLKCANSNYEEMSKDLDLMAHRTDFEIAFINGIRDQEKLEYLQRVYGAAPPLRDDDAGAGVNAHAKAFYARKIQEAYNLEKLPRNPTDEDFTKLAEQLEPLRRGYTPAAEVRARSLTKLRELAETYRQRGNSYLAEAALLQWMDDQNTHKLTDEEKTEIFNYLQACYKEAVGEATSLDNINRDEVKGAIAAARPDLTTEQLLKRGRTMNDNYKKEMLDKIKANGPGHIYMKDAATWRVFPSLQIIDGQLDSPGFFRGWDVKLSDARKKQIQGFYDPKQTSWKQDGRRRTRGT